MSDVIREATEGAATAGNPAPANATTQANRAQSASPAGPSPAGASLTWNLPPAAREFLDWLAQQNRKARNG